MGIHWKRKAAAGVGTVCIALGGVSVYAAPADTAEETQIYRLRNAESGEYLTVDGEMAQKQANLIVKEENGTLKQEFGVLGDEEIVLISQSGQRDLAVNIWGTRAQDGSNINLWEQTGEATQSWEAVPVSGGYLLRSSDHPNYVMGTYLGNVQAEAYVRGSMDQVWELIPVRGSGSSPVTAVSIWADRQIVSRNHTMELKLTCEPEDGDLRLAAWESSNPAVLSVSQDGVVTAKARGVAVISVSLPGGLRADLPLEVRDTEETGIAVQDANGQSSGICAAGAVFTLNPVFTPADASDRRAVWTSGDESVCRVDSYGTVTAYGEGTTVITAVSANGYSASYTVQVSDSAEGTIPLTGPVRSFQCNTPEEWEFLEALGGEEQLRRVNAGQEVWLPSEILDIQDYDEALEQTLTLGYLQNENENELFYPIDQNKYTTVLSDTPDWYQAVRDETKAPIAVETEKLETGIWLLARGADDSRRHYRVTEEDFCTYKNGFSGPRDVYLAWMDQGVICGLFQAETVTVAAPVPVQPPAEPQPAQPAPVGMTDSENRELLQAHYYANFQPGIPAVLLDVTRDGYTDMIIVDTVSDPAVAHGYVLSVVNHQVTLLEHKTGAKHQANGSFNWFLDMEQKTLIEYNQYMSQGRGTCEYVSYYLTADGERIYTGGFGIGNGYGNAGVISKAEWDGFHDQGAAYLTGKTVLAACYCEDYEGESQIQGTPENPFYEPAIEASSSEASASAETAETGEPEETPAQETPEAPSEPLTEAPPVLPEQTETLPLPTEEAQESFPPSEEAPTEPGQEPEKRIVYADEAGFTLLFPADWENRYLAEQTVNEAGDTVISVFCRNSAEALPSSGELFRIYLVSDPSLYLTEETSSLLYLADMTDSRDMAQQRAVLADTAGTECADDEEIRQEYAAMRQQVLQILDTFSSYRCDTDAELAMAEILKQDDMLPIETQIGLRYAPSLDPEIEAALSPAEKKKPHIWLPEDVRAFVREETFTEELSAIDGERKTGIVRQQEDGSLILEVTVSKEDTAPTGESIPLDAAWEEDRIWLCTATMTQGQSQYYFRVSPQDYRNFLNAVSLDADGKTGPVMEAVIADGAIQLLYDTAEAAAENF